MLDRIFKRVLGSAVLTGSLAVAGCGTSSVTSTDDMPAAPPRILTGTIIELPEDSTAAPHQPGRVDSPGFADSLAREIDPAPQPLRYQPIQRSEAATVDRKVKPAAAEVTPIPTTISTSITPEVDRDAPAPLFVARQSENPPVTPPQPQAPQPLVHSSHLVAVIQRAEEHNRQGFALATRGACFSARAEFIQALRGISQGLDAETNSSNFGRALAAGMRALEEAEDFVPRGARLSSDINVALVVRAHRTPVLHEAAKTDLAPIEAADLYRGFAIERLSAAVGGQTTGSLALHSLGKLYGLFAQDPTNTTVDPQGKSIVFQRAALLADPKNYLAANELAVLLAQQGSFVEARALLLQAITINPRPSMWHNLAVVHAQLGEMNLAELAHRTALSSAGGANPGNVQAMTALQAVRWVDPATFAQLSPPPADLNPAPPGAKPPQAAPPSPGSAAQKGMSRWNPWGTRQQ